MALRSLDRPAAPPVASAPSDLERAIRGGEMVLHYQPKVDLRTHQVVAVEALVRWQPPGSALVFPDQFIPEVEAAGLMPALTAVVLDQALEQYLAWRGAGTHLKVAVNAAASLLSDPRAVPHVARALSSRSIPTAALTIEVTESVVMTDVDAALHTLRALEHMGVTLSIDDFGTGYSSLSYLSRLPVHELKIDRSFVTTLVADENHQAIVRSTLGLGHGFGHRVVAEGVEDAATYAFLRRAGCDLAQGYFVARPMPHAAFDEWLCAVWPDRAKALAGATDDQPAGHPDAAAADDWVFVEARLHAYERMVGAELAADLTGALRTFVLAVGGRVALADEGEDVDLLPIDISLGDGDPLLPAAADGSRARRQLDRTLPTMVAHARRVAALLRNQTVSVAAR